MEVKLGPGLHVSYNSYYPTKDDAGYMKVEGMSDSRRVLDLSNPVVYPYVADWEHPDTGAQFVGIGTYGHVNDPDDPQFFFIRNIVSRVVERQLRGRPCVGLYEDVASGIADAMIALRERRESGWLECYMRSRGHEVASWDLTTKEITTLFLDNPNKLPVPFREAWETVRPAYTVGEVLAYHFFERIKHTQILDFGRRRKDGLAVGDPDTFAYDYLDKVEGVIEIFERHKIDFSEDRRATLHAQACAEAGMATPLPFDVLEAFEAGYKQIDYAELIWPPLSMHPDDYYQNCNLFKLVAGMIGPLRDYRFAQTVSNYLKRGVSVVATGGGGHVYWAAKYMHERHGIPLRGTIGAGRVACGGRIQGLAYAEPDIHHLAQQIQALSRTSC